MSREGVSGKAGGRHKVGLVAQGGGGRGEQVGGELLYCPLQPQIPPCCPDCCSDQDLHPPLASRLAPLPPDLLSSTLIQYPNQPKSCQFKQWWGVGGIGFMAEGGKGLWRLKRPSRAGSGHTGVS